MSEHLRSPIQENFPVATGGHTARPSEAGIIFFLLPYRRRGNSCPMLSFADKVSRAPPCPGWTRTQLQQNLLLLMKSESISPCRWMLVSTGLSLEPVRNFGCCNGKSVNPSQGPEYGGKEAACNGISLLSRGHRPAHCSLNAR
jgi:hypothetical protein